MTPEQTLIAHAASLVTRVVTHIGVAKAAIGASHESALLRRVAVVVQ